jgi:hypothetical protein
VLGLLRPLAAGDSQLRAVVARRAQSLESDRQALEKMRPSLEKLKAAPGDEAANLAVGTYYCLRARQWEKGLPYLARASDKKLRALAAGELSAANDPPKTLAIADAWWEYASTKGTPPADAKAIKIHAAQLYAQAQNAATGLTAKAIELRMAEAATLASDAGDGSEQIWKVLFRSSDPTLWNTNVDDGSDRFAVDVTHCPRDVRFLKLSTANGKAAIIPITADEISKDGSSSAGDIAWDGTDEFSWKAHHLGILKNSDHRPGIDVHGGNTVRRGWGFGSKNFHDDKQYYSWDGTEIPITVFEIAVKSGPLTESERKLLLK